MAEVNQQRIADLLKISRATVSRCFTNHPGINPLTRAKVFDLAAQLGYRHMKMRSGDAVQGVRAVVLICTEIEEFQRSDYESPGVELMSGVTEFGILKEVGIEAHYIDPKPKSLDDPTYVAVEALRKRPHQGVILIYPFPTEVIDVLVEKLPVVSLVEQYTHAHLNCIDVDHNRGIADLIDHLLALGHRRIGFYTKPYEVEACWSFRRFSAYVERMARLGVPVDPQDIVNVYSPGSMSLEASFDYVRDRIRDGVTAWVCAADHQAYDLLRALETQGLQAPRDFSITGFDGINVPGQNAALTTIVIPYHEIGLKGGLRLLDILENRFHSPQHVQVMGALKTGETTGPVPVRSIERP